MHYSTSDLQAPSAKSHQVSLQKNPAYTPSNLNSDDQFYATVDEEQEEKANEYDSASLAEEYDYENPYWMPADKKEELLEQFKKLRIKSVAQKDLE